MDSKSVKAVIDLFDYVRDIGQDRPNVAVFLKELGIESKTAWDAVVSSAQAIQATYPEYAIQITNDLFKLGLTIGYKYAIKKQMDKEFPCDDVAPESHDN